jgi:hypothetical protein
VNTSPRLPRLFLDCDGVLADFDTYAATIFGDHPRAAEERLGTSVFWDTLRDHHFFFEQLPLLPDTQALFDGVRHLDPTILTGCPHGGWAEPQKVRWAAKHFPGTKIITCRSQDKRLHMHQGDILIDDYTRYRALWEEAGGIFIHHTSASNSLEELHKRLRLPERVWWRLSTRRRGLSL